MSTTQTSLSPWQGKLQLQAPPGFKFTPSLLQSKHQLLADQMNLALIDPFQLAQDSPDALVDEFSKSKLHPEGEMRTQRTINIRTTLTL